MDARRDFLKQLTVGGLLPMLNVDGGFSAFDDQGAASSAWRADPQSREFWETFLQRQTVPASSVAALAAGTRAQDTDREPFFFYYETSQGLRPALEMQPNQLIQTGDLQVSMNVAAFKPANEDRATFERLQNAQLRIDIIQSHPIFNFIDPLAWTAVAALHPTKTGKLPPLQNLSFDPTAGTTKTQAFMLPGGEGRWAVNLMAQRKDSFFYQLLRQIVPEVDRFAPFILLPGISLLALNSFNAFYGALHQQPVALFKGAPVAVYGTADALNASGSSTGVPLRTGTYILVPSAHAPKLTDDRVRTLELKMGYMVPKGTDLQNVYSAATSPNALPDVTYATIEVSVKPATISADAKSKGSA